MNILGFEFKRKQPVQNVGSFVPPTSDDGSVLTSSSSSYYGLVIDVDTVVKNENDLIRKYREIAQYSDCESAIDEIVNEAIVSDPNMPIVSLSLDKLHVTDQIKEIIKNEFENILILLNFDEKAYDIFRIWYIDGRTYYHIIVDETAPQNGIVELRYIDPRKIRKIKNIQKTVGPGGVEIVSNIDEFFIYNNTGVTDNSSNGIKLSKDTVIYCTSGEFDANTNMVLSHLHPAVKPCNQLKMMEDALVIYRITRSSERRIFYIDVGNLSKFKAEQYIVDIMNRYRNKVVYNACLDMNTLVPLLDGRTLSLYDIEKEFNEGKELWAYSCDPVSGKFAPGLITSAGVTRRNEPVMRLTLDNGKTITCTYDHKFPVWNKGKIEAKDLVIGDSMIPFYDRTKAIHYKHPNSLYHQIFENNSKKWMFTHRLVSKWKDDNLLDNVFIYNEMYDSHDKNTIHHKNYKRLDNTPDNLAKMSKLDHFQYHKQHSSLSGKIGGKVTAQRKRENNLPMFNMTMEQRKELGSKTGKIIGPRMVLEQKGIHGLTKEETIKNAQLGGLAYKNKLLTDEKFASHISNIRKSFWDDDKRKEWANRAKNNCANSTTDFYATGNDVRWKGENAAQNKDHLAELYTIKYTDNILDVVEKCAKLNMSNTASIKFINENIDFTLWQSSNEKLISTGRNLLTSFTKYDLLRINKLCGYKNWTEYKSAMSLNMPTHKNHKIINIEYLSETIDVGTLGIDKNEIYHNYHTFALDAGIYTCNSTGEVVDNKRHMAMVEDFFMPRREGGRGTEITTLPGGCLSMDTSVSLLDGRELTIAEIANEMSFGKELWTYSCDPKSGAVVPGLISWAGVTQKSAKVMKICLDNGTEIIATPDHKWPQYGEEFKRTDELIVGDSLIPLYRNKVPLHKNQTNDYEKIFDNAKKEWVFTHRLVANYLADSVVKYYTYNSNISSGLYDVRHHKDFNRFNNDPNNLCFMSWFDHSILHNDIGFTKENQIKGSNAAYQKIKKMKEESPEEYAKYNNQRVNRLINWRNNLSKEDRKVYNDKVSIGVKNYLSNLSEEDKNIRLKTSIENLKIANKIYKEKRKNPEYVKWIYELISLGWTEEKRKKQAEITRKNSKQRWNDPIQKEKLLQQHKTHQKLEFSHDMLKFVIECVKHKTTHEITMIDVCAELNNNTKIVSEFCEINGKKSVPNWNINIGFTPNIVLKLVKSFGFKNWIDFRKKESIHNHKIISIEYLDAPIEVGTLTIDSEELYHNHHTFALSCGVFTKNSNLGDIADIEYFQTKLYNSLKVPLSRLQPQTPFSIGRSSEISREEVKFNKFVERLRKKFSFLFKDALKTQLILKGIIRVDEWNMIEPYIKFTFQKDNYFSELKESEIMQQRMALLNVVDNYVGKYYSSNWVRKNVLMQTELDIEEMQFDMEQDQKLLMMQQQEMMQQQNPNQDSPNN